MGTNMVGDGTRNKDDERTALHWRLGSIAPMNEQEWKRQRCFPCARTAMDITEFRHIAAVSGACSMRACVCRAARGARRLRFLRAHSSPKQTSSEAPYSNHDTTVKKPMDDPGLLSPGPAPSHWGFKQSLDTLVTQKFTDVLRGLTC